MNEYLDSLANALVDMRPKELIGALVIGLVLAQALTGPYRLLRRKGADDLMLMRGLILLASAASMALAVGYARYARVLDRESDGPFNGVVFRGRAPSGP